MSYQHQTDTLIPLRNWIEGEASAQLIAGFGKKNTQDELILRKTTIAYGIIELLQHVRSSPPVNSIGVQCCIDNFIVRISDNSRTDDPTMPTWNNIVGIDMICPQLSVKIYEPSFLFSGFYDNGGGGNSQEPLGRYLEVEFSDGADSSTNNNAGKSSDSNNSNSIDPNNEENARCHLFGVLLYELFSHLSIQMKNDGDSNETAGELQSESEEQGQPAPKKAKKHTPSVADFPSSVKQVVGPTTFVPLIELGFPPSICLLVQNLLECVDYTSTPRPPNAYKSLDIAMKDLHLLLLDPTRFIWELEPNVEDGKVALQFREHKLYGREKEVQLITDAFCRVSAGKSEAFFIGGFSGSGKSRLVNSLTARVELCDGYVLTHKFDEMPQERCLLEIISIFNDLCILIRKRSSPQSLLLLCNKIVNEFGADFSVLAHLLPNVTSLAPERPTSGNGDGAKESSDQMNLQSVCFLLQRFMRVVSSKEHPIMLFLDDLQWCDNKALRVLESVLCDPFCSTCLFFVGSYRSNEVSPSHEIFRLRTNLENFDVPCSFVSLEGLHLEHLKTMISDALCVFPRICESLSDLVYRKTKGNPFFVRVFIRSLVHKELLEYNSETKSWVWDIDRINSLESMDNVLHILSTKMNAFPENLQSALKVAASFGIMIKEAVVSNQTNSLSNIREGLEQAVEHGCMIKVSGGYKFVHDKIREAAYSLIPSSEKDQYHYSLGLSLYTLAKEKDSADEIIFAIADQINHGINENDSQAQNASVTIVPQQDHKKRLDIAEINELAGTKAYNCSDYETACSYFGIAMSLLPTDHWKRLYKLSHRLSFLWAKSAYACGDVEKARSITHEIIKECHCIEDKIASYYLLATIQYDCGEMSATYSTCVAVLTQLGENIPSSIDQRDAAAMMRDTSVLVKDITDTKLLEMKEMDNKISICMKFYSLLVRVAHSTKPTLKAFIGCRLVQLTMEHGICSHSIIGFVVYAVLICNNKQEMDIPNASRIGKAAMSCSIKRFHSQKQEMFPTLYLYFYSSVAYHSEPLQVCSDMLRKGFDLGMSTGRSGVALLNSMHHIKMALLSGEKLPKLLDQVDYYFQLANSHKAETAKMYLSIMRLTISTLIDKGRSSGTQQRQTSNDAALRNPNIAESMHFHSAIQAYWQGHSERCNHSVLKMLEVSSESAKISNIMIVFIRGINTFQVLKRTNTSKLRAIPRDAIATLKVATTHSRWNFRNKVHLLEAENFSFHDNHEEAKASYAAAITSARCSNFIHEQGLACELAGYHYKKIGDKQSALGFFNQARQCYQEWGSEMKVESITRQLGLLLGPSR